MRRMSASRLLLARSAKGICISGKCKHILEKNTNCIRRMEKFTLELTLASGANFFYDMDFCKTKRLESFGAGECNGSEGWSHSASLFSIILPSPFQNVVY